MFCLSPFPYLGTARSMASNSRFSSLSLGYRAERALARRTKSGPRSSSHFKGTTESASVGPEDCKSMAAWTRSSVVLRLRRDSRLPLPLWERGRGRGRRRLPFAAALDLRHSRFRDHEVERCLRVSFGLGLDPVCGQGSPGLAEQLFRALRAPESGEPRLSRFR